MFTKLTRIALFSLLILGWPALVLADLKDFWDEKAARSAASGCYEISGNCGRRCYKGSKKGESQHSKKCLKKCAKEIRDCSADVYIKHLKVDKLPAKAQAIVKKAQSKHLKALAACSGKEIACVEKSLANIEKLQKKRCGKKIKKELAQVKEGSFSTSNAMIKLECKDYKKLASVTRESWKTSGGVKKIAKWIHLNCTEKKINKPPGKLAEKAAADIIEELKDVMEYCDDSKLDKIEETCADKREACEEKANAKYFSPLMKGKQLDELKALTKGKKP